MSKQKLKRPERTSLLYVDLDTPSGSDEEQKMVGVALTNEDIEHYMSNIKNFLGAIPIEQLPQVKIPKSSFGIILLIRYGGIPHWVGLVVDVDEFWEIDFYDSFGRSPQQLEIKEDLEKFIRRAIEKIKPHYLLKYKVSRIKQQDVDSRSCGSYTVNFILDRLVNKKNFKDATNYNNHLKNVKEREGQITKFNFPFV